MGGKGGFGSLLRSMKPKAKGNENFDACRDLSGRRLRTVQNETRMKELQQKQEEEENYIAEELKEYEKNKSQLKSSINATNYKLDDDYMSKIESSASAIEAGVKIGLKNLQKVSTKKMDGDKKEVVGV